MPNGHRVLPGTQAEALALIRHLSERVGIRDTPAPVGQPTKMEIIAEHAVNPWMVSEFINEANFLTIPAGSNFIPLLTYQVPARNVGILEGITNAVSDILQYDFVQWQIRVDGQAVIGYDIIGGPIGFFPDVVQRIFHPLFQGQRVQVLANNIATIPAVDIAAKITGRVFPDALPSWHV